MKKNTLKNVFFLIFLPSFLCAQVHWEKTYNLGNNVPISDSKQTLDSGFVMVGFSPAAGIGRSDAVILKIDKNGVPQWSKAFGGNMDDQINALALSSDAGCIVAGNTRSYGSASGSIYLSKFDAGGSKVWAKTYGKNGSYGSANAIDSLSQGGFIIAGP